MPGLRFRGTGRVLEWSGEEFGRGPREPLVGFEPTTARLRIESSTPELQWRDVGCPGADSNRDAFRHYPLKIACLPVSPPGRNEAEQDSAPTGVGQPCSNLITDCATPTNAS